MQPPLGPKAQLNIFSNSFTGLFCFWESLSFACTRSLIRSSFPGLFAHAWEMMSWTWLHCVVGSHCQSAAASCSQRKYCTAVKRKKGKKTFWEGCWHQRVTAWSMFHGARMTESSKNRLVSYLLIPNNEASLKTERDRIQNSIFTMWH